MAETHQDASDPEQAVLLRISYGITREEFIAVSRWMTLRSRPMRLVLGAPLVIIIAGAALLTVGPVSLGVIVIIVGTLDLLVTVTSVAIAPAKVWRKRPSIGGTLTLEFSEAGIRTRSESTDAFVKWTAHAQVIERPTVYVLAFAGSNAQRLIPKRAFENANDEETFRALAARHIAKTELVPTTN